MLFNTFSYMNNELLCAGNTVAAIDELYLYLNNKTAIGYIRACMKRARKKESSLLLASQNVEDFLLPESAELTKPLFSIPAYQFLFHPGTRWTGENTGKRCSWKNVNMAAQELCAGELPVQMWG